MANTALVTLLTLTTVMDRHSLETEEKLIKRDHRLAMNRDRRGPGVRTWC
jgi:hypothetical protein